MGPWSHEEEVETFRGDIDLGAALTVIREHELAFYDRYLRRPKRLGRPAAARALRPRRRTSGAASASGRCRGTELHAWYLHCGRPREHDAATALVSAAGRRAGRPVRLRPRGPGTDDRRQQLGADDDPGRRDAGPPGPLDQRVLEARDDVLCYTSEQLDRDLEVIGPVEMVLYAASSARDTDFIVRLCDVYPNGKAIFLAEGMLRARYRDSARGGRVELLEPGEVAEYRIRCYPAANVFSAATGCGWT